MTVPFLNRWVMFDKDFGFRYDIPNLDYQVVDLPLVRRVSEWRLMFRGRVLGERQGDPHVYFLDGKDPAIIRERKLRDLIAEHETKIENGEIVVPNGKIRQAVSQWRWMLDGDARQQYNVVSAYLDVIERSASLLFSAFEGEPLTPISASSRQLLGFMERLFPSVNHIILCVALEDAGYKFVDEHINGRLLTTVEA